MKVIIAGSREYKNYSELCKFCDQVLSNQKEIEIVSGKCRGADKLGEDYAKERGYKITPFPADWTKYGKRAGYLRNEQMALYADALIAFYDGKSSGTTGMIELAKKHNLKIRVCAIKL